MDIASPDFVFPRMYQFAPFFTLQPVAVTRDRQLKMWCEFVLSYCSHHRIDCLDIDSSGGAQRCPLFRNASLERQLSQEAMVEVLRQLVRDGNGEWAVPDKRCLVYFKSPEQWADLIYKWASTHGFLDSVCTAYEIQHGDLAENQDFFGLDSNMILKALRVLEKRGKAEIFSGSTEQEHGVKFFR